MRSTILVGGTISAWILAIIYYQIKTIIGMDIEPLMYAAIITLVVGLYLGLQDNKETEKGEV